MRRVFPASLAGLLVLLSVFPGSPAAQPIVQELRVYTEVRNRNELTTDATGATVVNNPATRLLTALLEEAGITYTLRVYPWARIQQGLDNDINVLAYPVTRTAERESRWQWVGEIQPLRYYLFGLREQLGRLPRSLDEAREFRVGTLQGDVIDSYLADLDFTSLVHMTDVSRAPLLLLRGRFDLFAMGAHRIPEYTGLSGMEPDRLVPAVPLPEISTALYFALSRNTEPAILQRLQDAHEKISADGTLARIMQP